LEWRTCQRPEPPERGTQRPSVRVNMKKGGKKSHRPIFDTTTRKEKIRINKGNLHLGKGGKRSSWMSRKAAGGWENRPEKQTRGEWNRDKEGT